MNTLKENNAISFSQLVDNINADIYDGELVDIVEVTYGYKDLGNGLFWNNTLFSDFIDGNNDLDLEKIGLKVEGKLNDKLGLINYYIIQVTDMMTNSEQDEIKKELLLGSLVYVQNALLMTKKGLPFELEKAGYKKSMSDEEIIERVNKIEELEKINFGGKISHNPKEVELCYNFLYKNFKNNEGSLNDEETKEYNLYLEKIKELIPEYNSIMDSNLSGSKDEENFEEIGEKILSREKYIKILEIVLDILGLDIEIVQDERSSIYDGEDKLYIPLGSKYDNLKVSRITELIEHEVESHYNNLATNKKLIGNFRSKGNLEKEEGLAMVFEKILNGENIDNIGIPQHFPKVLACELFAGYDLKRFLELNNKISPDVGLKGRFNRLKRNYPINYKGGQHKDCSYGRGILKVIDYIKEGNDVRELFLGKVSIDDIPNVKRLLDLNSKKVGEEAHLPLFIGELVRFILSLEEKGTKKRNFDDFMLYIKSKYSFIDFSDIEIPVIDFSIKKKIANIIKIFRKAE